MSARKRLVIALGGNAILRSDQEATYQAQKENIDKSAELLAGLILKGYELVVTHGNGPQVGNLLLQNEYANTIVPAMPLDILNAETQGFLGYLIAQSMENVLRSNGAMRTVACLVTKVEVSAEDPGFKNPTKPVGGFFTKQEMQQKQTESGWNMVEDSGRGYRRVVASPKPMDIVELPVVQTLLDQNISVIAGGGGGIPVVKQLDGTYAGIEAVVDKDLTSCLMAIQLKADHLFILTDVPYVYIKYGTPSQQKLETVTVAEMERHISGGEFAAGSMGPKIEGAIRFVKQTGNAACICALDEVANAVEGQSGTWIIPNKTN